MKSQSSQVYRRRTAIVNVLVLLMVATVAACAPRTVPLDYMRVSVDGEPTLGIVRKDGSARGVVVFFHGLDNYEYSLIADDVHQTLTDQLVAAGFAVIASKAGGNAYGNRSSQRNYRELARVAMEHYRVENLFFLAESMGAIAAANLLASDDLPQVRGLAAINPVLNLSDPPSEHREAIAESFRGESLETVNPMSLPPEVLHGKQIRLYATPEDSLVPTDTNTLAFQTRFGSVADISVVSCTGPHLDSSCVQGDDIVKWFTQLESRDARAHA